MLLDAVTLILHRENILTKFHSTAGENKVAQLHRATGQTERQRDSVEKGNKHKSNKVIELTETDVKQAHGENRRISMLQYANMSQVTIHILVGKFLKIFSDIIHPQLFS